MFLPYALGLIIETGKKLLVYYSVYYFFYTEAHVVKKY